MQKIYLTTAVIIMLFFCGIMLLDRYSLNHSYSKISNVINKKDLELEKQKQEHETALRELNTKLQIRQQQFRIIMPYHSLEQKITGLNTPGSEQTAPVPVKNNDAPLTQYNNEPDLLAFAKELAGQIDKETVNAENIIKVFREIPDFKFGKTVFYNTSPLSPQLINVRAALLEALCREFGYNCETFLCWNMNTLEHFFKTTVFSSGALLDRATLVHGSGKENPQHRIITQKKPVSVLFPFHPIELNDRDQCVLMPDIHPIPVGGLYLHRIDVSRHPESKAKEWILEYRFKVSGNKLKNTPFLKDRQTHPQTMLSAVSLIPDSELLSSVSEGMQSFRIPFVDGKSSVLIVGDLPVLPAGITAYSIVE